MTLKELSQLYYLEKEIKREERRLAELKAAATSMTSVSNGMPYTGGIANRPALAADIADTQAMLQAKHDERMAERNRLLRYINAIDDSYIRQVLTLRFVDCMKWEEIADELHTSSWSVKHACYRFIDKN